MPQEVRDHVPASRKATGSQNLSEIGRRRMERRLASGRKSDERWQDVLKGAADAFRELGYPNTTLEDVATRVGVNRATLYYYVGTKEELLVALLYRPVHQMTANAKAIASLDLPPVERLARVLRRWITDMTEAPELMLAQNLHQILTGREADDLAANADEYSGVVTGLIAEGMDAGVFRTDVEPSIAMLAILGMFNWVSRWYDPEGPKTLSEIGESFTELAISSLRPPA